MTPGYGDDDETRRIRFGVCMRTKDDFGDVWKAAHGGGAVVHNSTRAAAVVVVVDFMIT